MRQIYSEVSLQQQHGRQVVDKEGAAEAEAAHDGHELGGASSKLEDERQLVHLVRVKVRES